MPIKPENRGRYPADWPEIRERILTRAGYQCEHPGCKARHLAVGYWHNDRWRPITQALVLAGAKVGSIVSIGDAGHRVKIIKVVLTIAHLDHQPENCADENLRAWCQRHHLRYDAQHHAQTAYATRRARANTQELF